MKRRYEIVARDGVLCVRVPLFRRNNDIAGHALVSLTDFEWIAEYRWRLHGEGYAVRQDGAVERLMHREVLGLPTGDSRQADHINGDRLDNRCGNLRAVLSRHNAQNRKAGLHSSRFRGVDWHEGRQRWRARGKVNGVQYHLGYFKDEDEAGRVASEWRATHLPFSVEGLESKHCASSAEHSAGFS